MNTIDSMERLIYSFSKLPGVGRKTAERYAYKVLELSDEDVRMFSESLLDAKIILNSVRCVVILPKTMCVQFVKLDSLI